VCVCVCVCVSVCVNVITVTGKLKLNQALFFLFSHVIQLRSTSCRLQQRVAVEVPFESLC